MIRKKTAFYPLSILHFPALCFVTPAGLHEAMTKAASEQASQMLLFPFGVSSALKASVAFRPILSSCL